MVEMKLGTIEDTPPSPVFLKITSLLVMNLVQIMVKL